MTSLPQCPVGIDIHNKLKLRKCENWLTFPDTFIAMILIVIQIFDEGLLFTFVTLCRGQHSDIHMNFKFSFVAYETIYLVKTIFLVSGT